MRCVEESLLGLVKGSRVFVFATCGVQTDVPAGNGPALTPGSLIMYDLSVDKTKTKTSAAAKPATSTAMAAPPPPSFSADVDTGLPGETPPPAFPPPSGSTPAVPTPTGVVTPGNLGMDPDQVAAAASAASAATLQSSMVCHSPARDPAFAHCYALL